MYYRLKGGNRNMIEVLKAIASLNIIGAAIALISLLIYKRYRDLRDQTREPYTKQRMLCLVVLVIGLIYLLMPMWLGLFV